MRAFSFPAPGNFRGRRVSNLGMYRDAAPRLACAVHAAAAACSSCARCGALACEPCTTFVGCAPRCVACAKRLLRAEERERSIGRVAIGVVAGSLIVAAALVCCFRNELMWFAGPYEVEEAKAALDRASCDSSRLAALTTALLAHDRQSIATDVVWRFRRRCGTTDRGLDEEARVFHSMREWRDEITTLRRLVARRPDDVQLQIRLAEAHLAARDDELAAEIYTKLLLEWGGFLGSNQVASRLVGLYIGAGRPDLATRVRRWLEDREPNFYAPVPLPDPDAVAWPSS